MEGILASLDPVDFFLLIAGFSVHLWSLIVLLRKGALPSIFYPGALFVLLNFRGNWALHYSEHGGIPLEHLRLFLFLLGRAPDHLPVLYSHEPLFPGF